MSHKEHKESKGIFRRIRSPLEHKNKAKHGTDDKHNRSSSTSVPPTLQQQQSNGHKRSGSDDVLRIENSAYGDPDALNNSHGIITPRSQSTGSSPGDALVNPPLPPRNPPKQPGSNMADESPLYVAPADTLQRGGGGGGSGGGGPSGISPAILSNYTRTEPPSGPPSRTERRVMEMHQLTMSQKQAQSSQPAQRVQAVIDDNSEYSTPFNVLQQQKARQKRNSFGSGSGSGRQRRVAQVGMVDEGDQIIPVLSPPPDRSQTTSPSSPLSTPSSEHEAEGGGVVGGGPSGSGTLAGGGGDSDYDIPWDKKFKEFPNFNRPSKRGSSSGKMHSLPEEHSPLKGRRQSPPHKNMYSQGGHPDRNSPPAPPERNHPIGGPAPHPSWRKTSSPQPPLDDGYTGRPRHLPSRHQSEQHRQRDGSTSPNQLVGRPYGHTIHGPHVPRELAPEISPRAGSMSIPSHISGRRLPSPPRERSESSPVDPNRRGLLRPPSPPNPVHIDFSIPLCDQPWYHGDIKRRDAEQVLIGQPDFSFLVRDSESCKTDFSLSIRDSANGFIHLRIVQETDTNNQVGYVLGQFSSHFSTVAECIAFYTKQRLNIRGAEHKKLRYPVPRASDTQATFRV